MAPGGGQELHGYDHRPYEQPTNYSARDATEAGLHGMPAAMNLGRKGGGAIYEVGSDGRLAISSAYNLHVQPAVSDSKEPASLVVEKEKDSDVSEANYQCSLGERAHEDSNDGKELTVGLSTLQINMEQNRSKEKTFLDKELLSEQSQTGEESKPNYPVQKSSTIYKKDPLKEDSVGDSTSFGHSSSEEMESKRKKNADPESQSRYEAKAKHKEMESGWKDDQGGSTDKRVYREGDLEGRSGPDTDQEGAAKEIN